MILKQSSLGYLAHASYMIAVDVSRPDLLAAIGVTADELAAMFCDQQLAFIQQDDPEDRAQDFQMGDLQSIDSLFISDAK